LVGLAATAPEAGAAATLAVTASATNRLTDRDRFALIPAAAFWCRSSRAIVSDRSHSIQNYPSGAPAGVV
jgi:hypothetical protein